MMWACTLYFKIILGGTVLSPLTANICEGFDGAPLNFLAIVVCLPDCLVHLYCIFCPVIA
jgi:hypothetical protein